LPRFIHSTDKQISWLADTYGKAIHVALKLRYLLLLLFFGGLGATVWVYQHVPTGFIPQEDQSFLMVIVQAPPGSSLAYTDALADRASAIIASESRHRGPSPSWASASPAAHPTPA
jgi:HAE1 family hydrophobic/amphiphilic exporter-1